MNGPGKDQDRAPGAAVSRRSFLGGALASGLASVFGLSGCSRREGGRGGGNRLNIQNWADYMHPDVIPEFERRYGIKVIYDTYSSNEGLLARMQAGASDYDLVVPSGYTLKLLRKMDLLTPIDKARVPNFKYVMPRFKNPAFDPDCKYSLPYTWGSTGIGYNIGAFGRSPGSRPNDWDVFWEKRLANRMTLLDDARETIGMALKRRGHSYNTVDEALIEKATRELIAEKPLVMAYTSDQVIVHLASGDSLASLIFSGDCYQAARSNPDIKYVIPESGASIWVDTWCIPRGAANIDNAYRFIDFMMEPEVAAKTADYIHYATPNEAALKLIDSEMRDDKNIYPPESVLDKCDEIADIGPAMFVYDRLWTELKCV